MDDATLRPAADDASVRSLRHAALCGRVVMEAFAPSAVLVDTASQCLYVVGRAERFLRFASGAPTHDLFALLPPLLRPPVRAALTEAMAAGQATQAATPGLTIDVRRLDDLGATVFLVSFLEAVRAVGAPQGDGEDMMRRSLDLARGERDAAVLDLSQSLEAQQLIDARARAAGAEARMASEALHAAKEEQQGLNKELKTLNRQLQTTLDRQRRTSDDLQNVLYSTDVATLFLDTALRIRFFTPASRALFHVIAADIGRPLTDLTSLSADSALPRDARHVLGDGTAIEREIETETGVWFNRRILPYRTDDGAIEGVVITFTDVTERKRSAEALDLAKRRAELANIAKSRFLAAASHDLRQPLQTLSLVHGLLASTVEGVKAKKLVARLEDTVAAMAAMLNTLLDINQIEAGTVHAAIERFAISDMMVRLRDELGYHARAKGLSLRVVPTRLMVNSDPRMLEQMVRNLLSNALKYTHAGKVLLGCRRRGAMISIEVWDTGIGIPSNELDAIFEEYHQLDNDARERSRGLGLGLTIVQRLAGLLGHKVRVQSGPGEGSMFAIEASMNQTAGIGPFQPATVDRQPLALAQAKAKPLILIVEDDMVVRDLLELLLDAKGYRTALARDGVEATDLVLQDGVRPDLVLADYNLPNGMDGVEIARLLRDERGLDMPVIILTGDITTATLRKIALHRCLHLHKPVKPVELVETIRRMLEGAPPEGHPAPLTEDASIVAAFQDDTGTELVEIGRDAARATLAGLTNRQRQIMALVLAGLPSKSIASELGLSLRTVESHRAAIMQKTESNSVPALARFALLAA